MPTQLIILADDLTGALEAGVKISSRNISALVLNDYTADFTRRKIFNTYDVLIFNTGSRHIAPESAKKRIRIIVQKAVAAGVKYFYKKTDSTLRGNIGAELDALMKYSGTIFLPYIPAHPAMKRFTKKGCQYLGKKLLHKTIFASDPLEPVRHSYLPSVIKNQSKREVLLFSLNNLKKLDSENLPGGIGIIDCESVRDLETIYKQLADFPGLHVIAGTAGFAGFLPGLFRLRAKRMNQKYPKGPVLIVNGSLNPVSLEQVDFISSKNHDIFLIENMLTENNRTKNRANKFNLLKTIKSGTESGKNIILSSSPWNIKNKKSNRRKLNYESVALHIGTLVKEIIEASKFGSLVVFGGDTLNGIVRALKCNSITPIGEIVNGVSLSFIHYQGKELFVISKPGGYGNKNMILQLLKQIRLK